MVGCCKKLSKADGTGSVGGGFDCANQTCWKWRKRKRKKKYFTALEVVGYVKKKRKKNERRDGWLRR